MGWIQRWSSRTYKDENRSMSEARGSAGGSPDMHNPIIRGRVRDVDIKSPTRLNETSLTHGRKMVSRSLQRRRRLELHDHEVHKVCRSPSASYRTQAHSGEHLQLS